MTRHLSAGHIQRLYRGWRCRLSASDLRRKQVEFVRNTQSAYQIQKLYRGSFVRGRDKLVKPALEALRAARIRERRSRSATLIQCQCRCILARRCRDTLHRDFLRKVECVVAVQSLIRMDRAKRLLNRLRREWRLLCKAHRQAATVIQSHVRRRFAESLLLALARERVLRIVKMNSSAVTIEKIYRGVLGRCLARQCRANVERRNAAATEIQRHFRGSRILRIEGIKMNHLGHFLACRARNEFRNSRLRSSAMQKRLKTHDSVERESRYDSELFKGDGQSLVGMHCQVYWPLEGRYFSGLIANFDSEQRKTWQILYEDGGKARQTQCDTCHAVLLLISHPSSSVSDGSYRL